MRNSALIALSIVAVPLGTPGCADTRSPGTPVSTDPSVSVIVAPFELPLASDVCYQLSVFGTSEIADMNATSLVWTQPSLCASDFGAEGGIRFTGICDAQAGGFDANGTALDPDHNNTVMLVLNDIYTAGDWDGDGVALVPNRDYINPCPEVADGQDNGCILEVPCTANQDKKVLFNLTVMRDAQLGFFDTVVKFQDVFCAAKLDCVDDDNTTLTYLHNPDAVPPGDGPTVVLGFACLGGDGEAVFMYLDDLEVTCRNGSDVITRTATVDPSGGPGNLVPSDIIQVGSPDVLFGAAVNTGDGFQGASFWNVLLGINLPGQAGETCTLHTTGTVSETDLDDNTTPANSRYPFIDWTVELTEDGNRTCTRHPLNGPDGGVETTYTPVDEPEHFDHELTFGCPFVAAEIVDAVEALATPVEPAWCINLDEADGREVALLVGPSGSWVVSAAAVNYPMLTEGEPYVVGFSGADGMEFTATDEAGFLACASEITKACELLEWPLEPVCITDSGCTNGQVCDGSTNSCVDCVDNDDCGGATPACDTASNICVACVTNADCSGDTPICDATTHLCTGEPCEGNVAPWTALTSSLPGARLAFGLATYNGYVYISGGNGGGGTADLLGDVWRSQINPSDGTLGAWESDGTFGVGRQGHTMVAHDGYMYIIGGNNDAVMHDYAEVLVAPIDDTDGSLGTWSNTTSLAAGRFFHTSVVHNGYVYAIGGFPFATMQVAAITSPGALGTWNLWPSLPGGNRWVHSSAVYDDFLYVIGGDSGPRADVQMFDMFAGMLGTWSATQGLPAGRSFGASEVNNGFLYVLGGYKWGPEYTNDVLVAPINSADGTLGTFTSLTNRFDIPRYAFRSFTDSGHLYVLGGSDGTTNGHLTSVQMTTFRTCTP